MTQLEGVNLIVHDMAASVDFYRRLGLPIPDGAQTRPIVSVEGTPITFETAALCRFYDSGWRETATNTLQFQFGSREAVDERFAELTAAGARAHLAPMDAFWGSRYAIVDDPDGNVIGLRSPIDPAMRRDYTGPRTAAAEGPVRMRGFVPYLHVTDASAMLDWYARVFGFTEIGRWTNEDGVVHNAEMRAGNTELWLDGGGRKKPDGQWIGVWVDDPDAMYEAVRAAGVEVSPPEDKPYGVRVVSVLDPEGYHWGFMRRTPS